MLCLTRYFFSEESGFWVPWGRWWNWCWQRGLYKWYKLQVDRSHLRKLSKDKQGILLSFSVWSFDEKLEYPFGIRDFLGNVWFFTSYSVLLILIYEGCLLNFGIREQNPILIIANASIVCVWTIYRRISPFWSRYLQNGHSKCSNRFLMCRKTLTFQVAWWKYSCLLEWFSRNPQLFG